MAKEDNVTTKVVGGIAAGAAAVGLIAVGIDEDGVAKADHDKMVADFETQVSDLKEAAAEGDASAETLASQLAASDAEAADQAAKIVELEEDLRELRELPGHGGFLDPRFGGRGGILSPELQQLISVALDEVEDDFNEIESCLEVEYDEDEMDIEDWDDVDFDFDLHDPSEFVIEFEEMEIDYDGDCTAFYDVEVEFDGSDIDVDFTLLDEEED